MSLQIDGSLFAKTRRRRAGRRRHHHHRDVRVLGRARIGLRELQPDRRAGRLLRRGRVQPGRRLGRARPTRSKSEGAVDRRRRLAEAFALLPNYPNPFNPITTIRYEIASREHVELRVFDVSGALVRTLVDEAKAAGAYSLEWNGRDDRGTPVSSGVYFYRLTAGAFSDVRKMTLVK